MKQIFMIVFILGFASQVNAAQADAEAGQLRAATCFACHGQNGISVSSDIPNLASQNAKYLTTQLQAFRKGTRKNDLMNVMAGTLSDEDIENVAAYFSGLPGAVKPVHSEMLSHVNQTQMRFPMDHQKTFTHYATVNFPERKQVRHYYANEVAVEAARKGETIPDGAIVIAEGYRAKLDANKKPIIGDDGNLVKDKLLFYTGMERQKGWGESIPADIRNSNWNYASFKADQSLNSKGFNQAKCLVCHKPEADASYLFSWKKLVKKAQSM